MREKNIRTKEKHRFLEVGKDTKLAKAEEYGFLTDARYVLASLYEGLSVRPSVCPLAFKRNRRNDIFSLQDV